MHARVVYTWGGKSVLSREVCPQFWSVPSSLHVSHPL